jgi:ATP-dependent NAD(P)H-hydrate dehydratase
METQELFAKIKSIFPSLAEDSKKGQNGKVAVVGGSYEFSGPPYYAAMATLRVGTDMAHIFCPKTSATAIKSYSPDLIVHPIFDIEQEVEFED